MSVQQLKESGIVDPTNNVNLMVSESPQKIIDIYSESIESDPEDYASLIKEIEERSQLYTGQQNNCTVENSDYAEAMVFLNRFDDHKQDEGIEPEIYSIASKLVEEGYGREAAEIGQKIEDNYDIGKGFSLEEDSYERHIEEEDAVIL